MTTKKILILPAILALSACGGGGGGGGGSDFATRGVQAANLLADYGNAPLTQVANMPTGTFNYKGVAGINFGNVSIDYIASNAEILADANLQANFDDNTISGSFTNFIDYTNTRGAGQVDLRNGTITGNEFTANATGSVTTNGNPLVVQGVLNGGFLGASADALTGRFDGTYGGNTVSGLVGAEKQ
jgi:hypothetical protein